MNVEQARLDLNSQNPVPLEPWGPYVSDRAWGTVREDYSANGNAWNYLDFEASHYTAYKWGEDAIGGICHYYQNLVFGLCMWNGNDPILKEKFFGLGNYEGNHGEDVKELYYYLDNLPSHFYMQMLYKYPQQAFPYEMLRTQNKELSRQEPEFEILDTGVFDHDEYFDVLLTYAKFHSLDMAIRVDVTNRGPHAADYFLLPQLSFHQRESNDRLEDRPIIEAVDAGKVIARHKRQGDYYFYFEETPEMLFTENTTNLQKREGKNNADIFVKDAFHAAIIQGLNKEELISRKFGSKFAPVYRVSIAPGETRTWYFRLSRNKLADPWEGIREIFEQRRGEADEFYAEQYPSARNEDHRNIYRQAMAGLLWSKQFYHYDVERWLNRNKDERTAALRAQGRNVDWRHLKNQDIILMPDKWEYPWYAAWDWAFHTISMAEIDPVFAKNQLLILTREWYMKPDGQLPAYEWNFSDVNPPVHAFAALQVYITEKRMTGQGDLDFLKRIFTKLLINFTWWINRKDVNGFNIFEGGFLGLDNIGVFNRSIQLSPDLRLNQADGTSWMGMYALNMMDIALEISLRDRSFEDTATKFFEHFVYIAEALNELGLWCNEDKFYYDVLTRKGADPIMMRIQSAVGLTSLFAVSVISRKALAALTDFEKRITWFEKYRLREEKFWPNEEKHDNQTILLSLVGQERLRELLVRMLSETEFLSPGGIRALSKYHEQKPYSVEIEGVNYSIQYDAGDSTSDFFGGNSNWRGPVWMPINYMLIQSVRKFGKFYGDEFEVEYPTGSGVMMNLEQVSLELSKRVISLFELDENGNRRLHGPYNKFYNRPENRHLILFYEYFNGDTGSGLGANHQTGWTALVGQLLNMVDKGE